MSGWERTFVFLPNAEGKTPELHGHKIKTPLASNVVKKKLPLYRRLSTEALLTRCLGARTQNINEAVHNVTWSKCPKTVYTSKIQARVGCI